MASYEKQTNKWTVRFKWIDKEGREVHKRLSGFSGKKEAEKAYMNFLAENPTNERKLNQGQILKFNECLAEYLSWYSSRVKESTIIEVRSNFKKHILPTFENTNIKKISKLDILQWQNNLESYSFKYKVKLRGALYGFFRYLSKYYDIDNIVAKVDGFIKPKIKKEMHIWTYEQFKKFITITQEPYTTFFMTLYFMGLRLGECMALAPGDLNFDKRTIKINKSITEKVKGAPFKVVAPKNLTSYREIEMSQELATHLKNYMKTINAKSEFLFGESRPFPTTTLRRIYADYIKKSELPAIRMHDFRHSHASLLIQLGANVLLIAKRLGHKNIEMTLNTYSHLWPTTENEIITKLDKFLGKV